jgi:hypothetical protein
MAGAPNLLIWSGPGHLHSKEADGVRALIKGEA